MAITLQSTTKKIVILSTIFSIFIYFGSGAISAKTYPSDGNYGKDNKLRYQDIDIPILSNVGVAIATNIGTDFSNASSNSGSNSGTSSVGASGTFDEILDINDMIDNPDKVRITMIQTNMLTIKEYLAYLRDDFRGNLASSSNKSQFLDGYIRQLEVRYKTATNNTQNLLEQKAYLEGIIRDSDSNIETIKLKLDNDFREFDDRSVMIDVENYLEQSKIRRVAYTYLVFTNKFIEQYSFLNNYNKELLDVLILNKQAIATDSYVVIPDSGSSMLQDFNLIYDESVFKAQQEQQQ